MIKIAGGIDVVFIFYSTAESRSSFALYIRPLYAPLGPINPVPCGIARRTHLPLCEPPLVGLGRG